MLKFVIMLILVTLFSRIYINKFDIKGKDVIALIIGFSLTGFLNLIQFVLKSLLDFVF